MRYVITDNRIDKKCEEGLLKRSFEIIRMPSLSSLQAPVSAHPDMLLFVGKGKLICHKDYFSIAEEQIKMIAEISGCEILLSDEKIGGKYPSDILFNAALVGDKLICKRSAVSKFVLELYSDNDVIDVKQGYAKCSICTVGDNAIITADKSIAKAARENRIDVLEIDNSHTRLEGYDCGFIGGASGDDGENIYFCGSIDLHPESERIKEFCKAHGRGVGSLSDEALYDYGTLMFI